MQIDFVIGDAYFSLKKAWHNCCNDHRCVHCKLSRVQPYKQQYPRKHVWKRWKPIMDENGEPSELQTLLETKIGEQNAPTFDAAENVLMSTAVATGTCARHKVRFTPSDRLRHLRKRRKQAHHNAIRKFLPFQIQGLQPYSKKKWHTRHRIYKKMSSYSSEPSHQHPALDQFAMMLEKLFAESPEAPMQPFHLTKELWTWQELIGAV